MTCSAKNFVKQCFPAICNESITTIPPSNCQFLVVFKKVDARFEFGDCDGYIFWAAVVLPFATLWEIIELASDKMGSSI